MMAQAQPCRVQWVTRANQMAGLVEEMTSSGGNLVARSSYDMATEDLDLIDDSDAGHLSIAEFSVDPNEMARRVVALSDQLAEDETLLIDLRGARPKVQLLPVSGKHGVIVRRRDGLLRFPRSVVGHSRRHRHWLASVMIEREQERRGMADAGRYPPCAIGPVTSRFR